MPLLHSCFTATRKKVQRKEFGLGERYNCCMLYFYIFILYFVICCYSVCIYKRIFNYSFLNACFSITPLIFFFFLCISCHSFAPCIRLMFPESHADILALIGDSLDNWRTKQYDWYQERTNNIQY
jgi:hypothetical protein